MTTETLTPCFPCAYPGAYTKAALKWCSENGKLCASHQAKFDALPDEKEEPAGTFKYQVKRGSAPPKRERYIPGEDRDE